MSKYNAGDKFKVVGDKHDFHDFNIGDIVTLIGKDGGVWLVYNEDKKGWILWDDLQKIN